MSNFFEDFDEGREFAPGTERTLSAQDLSTFADLTGDHTALHTSDARANETVFGARIAHGALVFSLSVGLTTQMGLIDETLIAFAGVDRLRFVGPVYVGDTIRVAKRVVQCRAVDARRGVVVFETKVVNQHAATVLIYSDKLLLKRRAVNPADATNETVAG